MLNGAQLHLAVNHMPVIGMLLGMMVLLAGIILTKGKQILTFRKWLWRWKKR